VAPERPRLLPTDALRGQQVLKSPNAQGNAGRTVRSSRKNRRGRRKGDLSQTASSIEGLHQRSQPKRGGLTYTNEDLGMMLNLYSFRYDQWDDCTIVGVDPRKKLHCCYYTEEGTKNWHDLKQKKFKIVGFNGQMRVVESAPVKDSTSEILGRFNGAIDPRQRNMVDKIGHMAQQYGGSSSSSRYS